MKKIYINISSIIFFILIILPITKHMLGGSDHGYIKKIEKRNPNQFPKAPESIKQLSDYLNKLELYLKDFYGFRSSLITFHNLFMLSLGTSGSKQVITGKEGWLYFTQNRLIEQYRGLDTFTDEKLNEWLDIMEMRKNWLSGQNINFLVVVAPNKCTIFPEYLPDWVTKVGETRLDQIKEALEKNKRFEFLDLRPEMINAKKTGKPYFQTDSHWNTYGAYFGYLSIMEKIKKLYPNTTTIERDQVNFFYYTHYGQDLSRLLNVSRLIPEKNGVKIEISKKPVLKEWNPIKSSEKKSKFYHIGIQSIVKTTLDDHIKAMIFGDSFTNSMMPFLNNSFKEVVYARAESKLNKALIKRYKPDIVIFVLIERALRNPLK